MQRGKDLSALSMPHIPLFIEKELRLQRQRRYFADDQRLPTPGPLRFNPRKKAAMTSRVHYACALRDAESRMPSASAMQPPLEHS